MSFIKRLQDRWQLKYAYQVWLILVVFACTGTTVWLIKPFVLGLFSNSQGIVFSIIYYILIFPVYNLILLLYGALFGLFGFFWSREKKMFNKILKRKSD